MISQKSFYLPRPDRFVSRFRARLSKPSIDSGKINYLLKDYDLELVSKPYVPPGRGRSNSIIIDTDQGRKVLKWYKNTVLDSMIEHEHSIVEELYENGYHVPKIVTTNSGNTVATSGSARFVLFDFIYGGFHYHNYWFPPSHEKRYISASGKELAVLHQGLKDFIPRGNNPNGFTGLEGDRGRNLDWYVEQSKINQKQFIQISGGKPHRAETKLQNQAEKILKSLVDLEKEINQANLPKQLIHGDYGPYNILFKGNKIIAVLDFELARLDWRITELVYALPRFAETRLGFDFNKVNCLIDSYRSVYCIENIELQLIPRIWKYFRLKRCIVCWSRYHETSQSLWLDLALENFQRAEVLTKHEDHFLTL
jgi:Ser/Thr protein kinase RdoA (MazF antagonist)